jgi:hypothetical protein
VPSTDQSSQAYQPRVNSTPLLSGLVMAAMIFLPFFVSGMIISELMVIDNRIVLH